MVLRGTGTGSVPGTDALHVFYVGQEITHNLFESDKLATITTCDRQNYASGFASFLSPDRSSCLFAWVMLSSAKLERGALEIPLSDGGSVNDHPFPVERETFCLTFGFVSKNSDH